MIGDHEQRGNPCGITQAQSRGATPDLPAPVRIAGTGSAQRRRARRGREGAARRGAGGIRKRPRPRSALARSVGGAAGAQSILSWQVTIRPAAHADLREARDWYDRRREGLGSEFLLAVADAMLSLEEAPQRPPIYYRDFRRVLTDRFPFKVFYRIEGRTVIVYRVLHGA